MRIRFGLAVAVLALATLWAMNATAEKPARRTAEKPARRTAEKPTRKIAVRSRVGPKVKARSIAWEQTLAEVQAAARRRIMENHGTRIFPHPDAAGPARDFQLAIARRFFEQAPLPQERVRNFEWLDSPNMPPMRIGGWNGQITDVTRTPRGHLVTVKVGPHLLSGVGDVFTSDQLFEVYEYIDGRLRFVQGTRVPGTHKIVTVN